MSIFKFTNAAGAAFEVQGPPGATVEQAREIFEKQVDTGGLTGIPVGGVVNAVTQAAGGLQSALAQIGSRAVALTKQIGGAINLPIRPGTPVPNAISISDFVNTKTSAQNIGTIASAQIQGLVAQTSASVNQAFDKITDTKGVGQFGFDANQLQLSGLIKPGLADQINADPAKFTEILSSPTSWTGNAGVTDVDTLLSDSGLQTAVQQDLMNANFGQLKQLGTITGTEVADQLGPLLNNATKFGADTATAWLDGASSEITNQLNNFATSALFGQKFASVNSSISGGASPLQAGVVVAKGVNNTTDRTTLDQATRAIIGNRKITVPDFTPQTTRVLRA